MKYSPARATPSQASSYKFQLSTLVFFAASPPSPALRHSPRRLADEKNLLPSCKMPHELVDDDDSDDLWERVAQQLHVDPLSTCLAHRYEGY